MVTEKYENGSKIMFLHEHSGILVTSDHFSDMQVF